MTQISDDRLMEIKARGNQFVDKSRGSYGIPAIEMEQIIDELLSARATIADKDKLIERLVEKGDKLADSVSVWMKEYKPYSSLVQSINRNNMRAWDALMKELEGKGFDAAMKRVLDENKGAWKALGGEEGKG